MSENDQGTGPVTSTTTVLIRAGAKLAGSGDTGDRTHYLVVVEGAERGRRIELVGDAIVLGRQEPAGLVLADSQISRNHCRIAQVVGEVFVTDLDSKNGTFIDGQKISRTSLLSPGARLIVGGHVLEHEWRSRKEIESAKELDLDLDKAGQYVRALLPSPLAEGPVHVQWTLLPSTRLGGDAFGYQFLDARTFVIYLLDVSGHGTGAAMHAVSVMNVLRKGAFPGADARDPAQVLGYLNETFQMESHGGMYLTFWYGVYDLETRVLSYATAGHHPAYLLDPDLPRALALRTKNVVLGATPTYTYRADSTVVEPGSVLYIFSDGVFEIETQDGREGTLDDFVALIQAPQVAGTPETQRLLDGVRALSRKPAFDDDFTLVVASFS